MFVVRHRNSGVRGFYCGRPSVLGNPYKITAQRTRDDVCDMYAAYFKGFSQTTQARTVLNDLLRIHRELQPKTMFLLCHCYPERCHCETIAEYLNSELDKDALI